MWDVEGLLADLMFAKDGRDWQYTKLYAGPNPTRKLPAYQPNRLQNHLCKAHVPIALALVLRTKGAESAKRRERVHCCKPGMVTL